MTIYLRRQAKEHIYDYISKAPGKGAHIIIIIERHLYQVREL